jgi:hypothetical protein
MAVMACSWSLASGESMKPSSIGMAPEKHIHAQYSVGLFRCLSIRMAALACLASGKLMKPSSNLLHLKENIHARRGKQSRSRFGVGRLYGRNGMLSRFGTGRVGKSPAVE